MKSYLEILKEIKVNGKVKSDRTGTGIVYSFGRRFRHDLRDGFPLLTTKKINPIKPFAEIFCFLKGYTNIAEFNKLECNIWDPWGLSKDIYYRKEKSVPDVMRELFKAVHGTDGFTDEQLLKLNEEQTEKIFKYNERLAEVSTEKRLKYMLKHNPPLSYFKMAEKIGINVSEAVYDLKEGYLGPIYGHQWINWNNENINQIKNLIESLTTVPNSRRHVVTCWNPSVIPDIDYKANPLTGEELSTSKEKVDAAIMDGKQALPPCHMFMVFDVDTSESKHVLNLHMVMRSCDVPVGLPFNIAGYAFLLSLIAKQVDMVAGELLIDITNAHIYQDQLELVDIQLEREPFQLSKFNVPDGIDVTDPSTLTVENLHRCVSGLEDYQHHPFIKYPVSV